MEHPLSVLCTVQTAVHHTIYRALKRWKWFCKNCTRTRSWNENPFLERRWNVALVSQLRRRPQESQTVASNNDSHAMLCSGAGSPSCLRQKACESLSSSLPRQHRMARHQARKPTSKTQKPNRERQPKGRSGQGTVTNPFFVACPTSICLVLCYTASTRWGHRADTIL